MEQIKNPFSACLAIFTQPNAVFALINEKHNWSWVAFLVVMIFTILPSYAYFNMVDFSWYVENVISTTMNDVSPSEKDVFRNALTPLSFKISIFLIVPLFLIGINAIFAVYLNTVTQADEHNINGFTDWFGFMWWVWLPTGIGCSASLLMMLFAGDPQLPESDINPLTLSYLLGLNMQSDWIGLANFIRPDLFLGMYFMVVGVHQWTRFSSKQVYAIGLAPFAALLGIWLLMLIF